MDMNRGTNKRIDIETRLRKINQEFRQEYEIAKSMSKNFINAALEQKVERLETNHKINNQRRENQLENKRLEKTHQDYKQHKEHKQYREHKQIQLRREISDIIDSSRYPKNTISPQKKEIMKPRPIEQSPLTTRHKRQTSSMKPSQSIEAYLTQYKMKLEKQKQLREEVQSARKRLQYQNSKLLSELSAKNKYKEQIVSGWREQKQNLEGQILKLKNRFEEENTRLEEEIRGYQERIDGLEGELSGLKTELVGSVSYENWMEEKGKLEKEIKMYKQLNYLKDQQKFDKVKLEKQVLDLKNELEVHINIMEEERTRHSSERGELQKQLGELEETNESMSKQVNSLKKADIKKQSQIKMYKSEIQKHKQTIHQREIDYQDLQKQYKNLQSQFFKKEQFYLNLFKEQESEIRNSVSSLQTLLEKQKQGNHKLCLQIIDLQRSIEEITMKLADEIKLNGELQEHMRNKTMEHEEAETEMENMFMEKVKEIETELISLRDEKSAKLQAEIDVKINEKFHEKIISNLNLEIEQLQGENQELHKGIQSKKEEVSVLEEKVQILQKKQIKQIQQIKQIIPPSSLSNTSLDDLISEQIKQNQGLKLSIKNKDEQIFILKSEIQDYKRKIESQKTELQIFKLKNVSDSNKLRREYEIQIEDLQCKMEINERKYEILQNKFKTKVQEMKKKNEFIQNVIVSKIGKEESSEQDYFIKETRRFFNFTEEIQSEMKVENTE